MTDIKGATWFTSDLHLGHKLVAGLRGFTDNGHNLGPNTKEHDARLASNWDSLIRASDTVWLLGDITLENDPTRALRWLQARPGTKRLVLGNHDAIHPAHRGAQKAFDRLGQVYYDIFASIQTFARIHLPDSREVLLSHFPYPGTSEGIDNEGKPYDDRYHQYRLINLGIPLVHGHTHRPERMSYNSPQGSLIDATPQLHIGLDAWNMSPVHISEVQEAFDNA